MDEKNITFTIVITTYGRPNKIERAIESVLYQTYKKFEIIIIDDNGRNTENQKITEKIIEKYKEKVIYVIQEENSGANSARNKGVLRAEGEYMAFLDDDEFLENKLEEVNKILNKERYDLIYSGACIIDAKTKRCYYFKHENIKKEILKGNYIGSTSFVVVKKEKIIQAGLFNEKLKSCQDWELWIRLIFFDSKIYGINKTLVNYYIDIKEKTRISNNIKKRLQGHYYIYNITKNKHLNLFKLKDKREIIYHQKVRILSIYYEGFRFKEYRKLFKVVYYKKYAGIKNYLKYIFSIFNLKITKKGLIRMEK